MDQARIFVHYEESEFAKKLLGLPCLRHSVRIQSSDQGSWLDELGALECDLAIVDVSATSNKALEALADCDCELMVLSDGRPNPYLDTLMRKGVSYHFRKPFDLDVINELVQGFLEDFTASNPSASKVLTSDLDQFGLLVGSSKKMRKLYRAIRRVAPTEANVLIVGESGTGKELVAQTCHLMSDISDGPMVAINCGALSPELIDSELFGHVKGAFTGASRDHSGVFTQAQNGTIFLDEVTEMPIELQVKLLRVLEQEEYKPVGSSQILKTNARIIAATNRDPFKAIEEGELREDLYFRLAQFPLEVPPLRDRGDDILGLAKHFIAYRNKAEKLDIQLDQTAATKIKEYSWPGNVRELKHSIERAYILSKNGIICSSDLEFSTSSNEAIQTNAVPAGVPLEEIEKVAIQQTLEDNDGNKKETAEQLGISVKTLYNKIEKYS